MRTHSLVLALIMVPAALSGAATMLDRVVATVNGRVILLSDWDEEVRFECFMAGRSLPELSREERKAALDRLIDQELVKEQVQGGESEPKAEEVNRELARLKSEYSKSGSRPSWEAQLESYGLSEKTLRKHVAVELGELRLIDERFRPSVRVSAAEIEAYYQHELLPKLQASAAPSLSQASDGIRKLLIEEKINQMMSSWLQALRRQARIRLSSAEPDRPRGELE